MNQMVTWGAKTVGNAVFVKSINSGKPLEIDCSEDSKAAWEKYSSISQAFWDESMKECEQPIESEELTRRFAVKAYEEISGRFAIKIFDWVNKHIYD